MTRPTFPSTPLASPLPHQVIIPKLSHDSSQLRADMTGRLLRFLVPESGIVEAGQAYAEVETMKMTSELVARARGKVHLALTNLT